ncbi:hypothetical protein NVV94_25670 [Pseudomonas sp. LS1212]|uniref:hypothetical protein n=1 Tax=Pseudomonas sp. LS1212 TaxID=2972478 RepID=UPI00215D1897|nr:hypothetical protein [Pseudomonas sp. LS1212]UVJ43865.1 hypothetical protein NVV94_25670 [Pseudomonas sp. LS1212]
MPRSKLQCALMRLVMVVLLAAGALSVQAQTVTIKAFYEPDPKDPMNTRFINTTPQAAFCVRWPNHCRGLNAFSVGLPVTYSKETERGAGDVRDRFFIQLPAQRNFRITNNATGGSYPVEFRMTHISQKASARNGGGNSHPLNTAYVGGGCQYLQAFYYAHRPTEVYYVWATRSPAAPTGCHSHSLNEETGFLNPVDIDEFGIGFELMLPPPLDLPNGMYSAQQTFTVGPGGDFDPGNGVSNLSTSTVTLNFELAVNHHLKTEFPPGSNLAVLEPKGGWGSWVHQGQRPTGLQREMPFRVWASGPFKMYTTCQYQSAGQCAMRKRGTDDVLVPYSVAVTLPAHVQVASGRPVRRERLPVGAGGALAFRTVNAAFNEPAALHFEAQAAAVTRMLDHPGSQFEGVVTIHFEAQI